MATINIKFQKSDWIIPVYDGIKAYTTCFACCKMKVFITEFGAAALCDFCEAELTDAEKDFYELNPNEEV